VSSGSQDQPIPDHDVRGVLRITAFRRLWLSLGLSSFGDWLGLLATTALAASLGGQSSYAAANLAVSGVLVLRLAPAILFGPLAGALADRFDRKVTMVVGDVLRFGLFASIPVIGTLWWLFVATVLIEVIGLFWMPAKDATVPNLVPRSRLEAANQVSLATTYGSAPFAALLFSGLALVSGALDNVLDFIGGPIDLALYVNALTYLVAAAVIWNLDMPRRPTAGDLAAGQTARPSVGRTIIEGWQFVGQTKLVRGLVIGMLGAFGAGGFVIGVAPSFVADLGAGEPGYGILFACVFTGLAAGMFVGPRLLAELPRWRLFGLSIVVAGLFLALVALIPNIVLASLFTVGLGIGAGVAWVTGYTMLGLEVADELRGRTFAFVQSAARIVLVAVMALAPAIAALIGTHQVQFTPDVALMYNGASLTLLIAAVLAVGIGVLSYRQMHDDRGVPLLTDLVTAWQRRHVGQPHPQRHRDKTGFFVAFEGGDGAGKSTQLELLRCWLVDELGHDVVATREPGATDQGARIRELVLHGGHLDARAEALLYAADRAHHVASVVRPALERGAVVVTDRYVDSSVAYQGAGRELDGDEVAQLSRWATQGLVPDLTVLFDVSPETGQRRRGGRGRGEDRLESEPDEFHARVRDRFLELARRHPRRYLVLDAELGADELAEQVRRRLTGVLPLSARQVSGREAHAQAPRTEPIDLSDELFGPSDEQQERHR
jgi:dTMP kinase